MRPNIVIPYKPSRVYVDEWKLTVKGTQKSTVKHINLDQFASDWIDYSPITILINPTSKLAVWIHLHTNT